MSDEAVTQTQSDQPPRFDTIGPYIAVSQLRKAAEGGGMEQEGARMTRHTELATALVVALSFASLAGIVEAQVARPNVTMASGEEKEICSGVSAAVIPNPSFGELRIDDSTPAGRRIFYKAGNTSVSVNETLTCTADDQKRTVTVSVSPLLGSAARPLTTFELLWQAVTSSTGLALIGIAGALAVYGLFSANRRDRELKLERDVLKAELERMRQLDAQLDARERERDDERNRDQAQLALDRERLEANYQRQLEEANRPPAMVLHPAGSTGDVVAPDAPPPPVIDTVRVAAGEWPRVPDVPGELIADCAAGRCILFAGTGLDAQLGIPSWSDMLARLIDRASTQGLLTETATLQQALARGDLERVESVVRTRLDRRTVLDLADDLLRPPGQDSSAAHRALADIPFQTALTSSWSRSLDRLFVDRDPLLVTPTGPTLQKALSGTQFCVIHLFGDLAPGEVAAFGADEFRALMNDNETFRRLVAGLVQDWTVLFIGISAKGLEEFFKAIRFSAGRKEHFALMPRSADWQFQEESFGASYKTRLLWYTEDQRHTAVPGFLEALHERIGDQGAVAPRPALQSQTITRLVLDNIGPFAKLDLALNPGWNVLLGNNGCGKSTILKAIALGLCGDEPLAAGAAQRLLKADETDGSVRIELGDTHYLTRLKREASGVVRVLTGQLTPLQRGRWVSLGFPALRGISTESLTGPSGRSRPKPEVGDLLPLLTGAEDNRLAAVKQWIVNLDVKSTPGPEVTDEEAARNVKVRDDFFARLDSLCPGVNFSFDRVTRDTWDVYVKTQDGKASVPIEQVSQGTTSFLGWIGTVLQRGYEIHGSTETAETAPAVVLVDEIDAHLHPAWQKSLVPLVTGRFKNLQIITTTHSPLIVAGMKAQEVFIVQRDPAMPDVVSVTRAPVEVEGLRADQILTSPLFGLASSRSDQADRDVDKYSRLLGIPASERTTDEQRDFDQLREQLMAQSVDGETAVERRVQQAVRQELQKVVQPDAEISGSKLDVETELRLRERLSEVFRPEESAR